MGATNNGHSTPDYARRSEQIALRQRSPGAGIGKQPAPPPGTPSTALLTRPFPPTAIRRRAGHGGSQLDYVAGGDIIRRILDGTANGFGWRLDELTLYGEAIGRGFWLVRGTLAIPGLGDRAGVGTHPADSVDAPKAAETDALKRAAVKFGVALHLYEDDPGPNPAAPAEPEFTAAIPEAPPVGYTHRRKGSTASILGPCPSCHAPTGKPHATRCPVLADFLVDE